jgi:uncharacterized protein YbjT (DUF2867 family)
MKVLVLGGTGYVGRSLIPRLIMEGHQVRCLVRDPNKAVSHDVETVRGDASDEAAVDFAVTGCDSIVHLIHTMGNQSENFEELDKNIATNVSAAANRHEVEQIVYLGGLGNRKLDQTPHLRSRHEVARVLREGSAPVTELRAAVIIGSGSASFEMIKTLVKRLPVMICPKWVNVKTQPIAIEDVLEYIIGSLGVLSSQSRSIDIGGPTILSYREMMLAVAKKMHLRRLIIPVPVLTPWLSSHWVNLVTSVAAPLARALIESVRSETICENDTARQMFDFDPLGFEEAVSRALAQDGPVSPIAK